MIYFQSEKGTLFIAGWEAFSATPYKDIAGIPTIGYGSTHYEGGNAVTMLDPPITKARGFALLRHECNKSVAALNRLVKASVSLKQNEVDALVSFIYNVGVNGFVSSTIWATINGDLSGPSKVTREMFTRWNKIHDPRTGTLHPADGLTNRRNAEYTLYSA